jgi:hypothetical protein
MDERSRLAREILIAALLLGAAADGLLRVGPWSLNLTLWITVVLAVTVGMATRHRVDWPRDTIWLVAPVVLFAMAISWRGTPVLMLLDLGAIAVCITVWGMRLESVQIPNQGILDYARGALNLGVSTAAGAAPLADKKISVVPEARSVKWKHARAATLGVAISLPLLFVFGGLLMAADAVFDQMVSATFDIDLGRLASHGVLTGIFAWIVCGFLLLILRFSKPHLKEAFTIERPSLGIVEVAVPLALVNLLFLAFVVVQLRYLFGDASLVQETVGLTYSEYARRGFFELVAVAALVLPLLLIGDWLLTGADSRSRRVFRGRAGAMLLRHCGVSPQTNEPVSNRLRPDRCASLHDRVHDLAGDYAGLVRGHRTQRSPSLLRYWRIDRRSLHGRRPQRGQPGRPHRPREHDPGAGGERVRRPLRIIPERRCGAGALGRTRESGPGRPRRYRQAAPGPLVRGSR